MYPACGCNHSCGEIWLIEYEKRQQLGLSDQNVENYHISRKIDEFFEQDTQQCV